MAHAQHSTSSSSEEDVQLLEIWVSPYVMRVKLALAAKGIAYTNIPQDLAPFVMRLQVLRGLSQLDPNTHKSPLLLQSNPIYKMIPVLLHKGKPICESLIICEYLDEAFPGAPHGKADLLPKDPYLKAMARFWADFCDKKALLSITKMLQLPREALEAALEESKGYLGILEAEFAKGEEGGPFFGGRQEVGFVDVVLGPLLVALPVLESIVLAPAGFDTGDPWGIEKMPHLQAWLKAFGDSPVAACLPSLVELAEGGKSTRKALFPDE